MRTNIDIDDDLLARAMQAGPCMTKKDTVEAGLRMLARQAAYREILKWEGKLKWEGDESIDWTEFDTDAEGENGPIRASAARRVQESRPPDLADHPDERTAIPVKRARDERTSKAGGRRRAGR